MKTMFPREFVIWFKSMDAITFAASYLNSNLFHWRRESDTTINISEYTLDDLYKYWRLEIEPKTKEDE